MPFWINEKERMRKEEDRVKNVKLDGSEWQYFHIFCVMCRG